jgi:hypothetical protein
VQQAFVVIPAQADCEGRPHFRHFRHPWRSDAGADIREANGPKGEPRMRRVNPLCFVIHDQDEFPRSRE